MLTQRRHIDEKLTISCGRKELSVLRRKETRRKKDWPVESTKSRLDVRLCLNLLLGDAVGDASFSITTVLTAVVYPLSLDCSVVYSTVVYLNL